MDTTIVRKVLLDCFRIDSPVYPRAPVLSVAHDNDRSLLYKGRYYAPLVDTIEDDLAVAGVRCVSVARIISAIKGDAAYGRVHSPEGKFARALVQKRLLGLVSRGRYPYSTLEERAWGSVLDATGAKKLFGILPSRELCSACHRRGVWVADVQHGVIADTHPWYGAAFRANDPAGQVPDAFLCWDEGSADVIRAWAGAKGAAIRIVGNRWLARFRFPPGVDRMVDELCDEYDAAPAPGDGRATILLSLSWGEDNIPNGFLVDGLESAIRASADRNRWLIRLHPNQLRGFATDEGKRFVDYFRQRLEGFAEWEVATRAPLPIVLRSTDLHVSWQSSVSLEAAQMGVRTALLNPRLRSNQRNADYYRYYRDAGLIDLVSEQECDILSWIDANRASKRAPEVFDRFDAEYRNVLAFLSS